MAYQIEYLPDAGKHLRFLETRDQRKVLDTVDERLAHEPLTRNRKPMRRIRLRMGASQRARRVYYEVKGDPDPLVRILAVGVKDRNVVRIGGEEIEL